MYAAVGGILAGIVWWIFKKTPAPPSRATITKDVAPVTPPAERPTVGAVASRFDEMVELYRMGYLSPEKAIGQTESLEVQMAVLIMNGRGEQHSAEALVARTQAFIREVKSFQASMTTPEA